MQKSGFDFSKTDDSMSFLQAKKETKKHSKYSINH